MYRTVALTVSTVFLRSLKSNFELVNGMISLRLEYSDLVGETLNVSESLVSSRLYRRIKKACLLGCILANARVEVICYGASWSLCFDPTLYSPKRIRIQSI